MNDKQMIKRLDRLIAQAEGAKRMIRMGMMKTNLNYHEPGMEHYDFRIGDFRIKEGFTIMYSGAARPSTDPLGEACEPSNGWNLCECP